MVIREGYRPLARLESIVEGKSKGVVVDRIADEVVILVFPSKLDTESLTSSDVVLKVKNCVDGDKVDEVVDDNASVSKFTSAWQNTQHIKLNFNFNSTQLTEDGLAVKLNTDKEMANSQVLKKSLVIKLLGQDISFSILCLFASMDSLEEVLSGGPWYIGNHIIGMDRWSSSISTESLKGITSPVWIRFPGLPLSCWDEENIPMIASMIRVPMMLDGNSFKWGKREYARCCVQIDLERKHPKGVWIEGLHGRTFQQVEYEKLTSLCYQCGRVGHNKNVCPNAVSVLDKEKSIQEAKEVLKQGKAIKDDGEIPVTLNKFQTLDSDLEEGEVIEKASVELLKKSKMVDSDEAVVTPEGARKREASLYLRDIVKDYKGFFMGLTETKMSSIDKNDIDQIIGSDWDYFHHPAIGMSGGILVIWKKELASFEIVDHSSQLIMGHLNINALGKWNIATVYEALHNIPMAKVHHLPRVASDHAPISLNLVEPHNQKSVFLRFEDTWKSYPPTWNIIFKAWNKLDFCSSAEVLQRKLRSSLKALYYRNKNKSFQKKWSAREYKLTDWSSCLENLRISKEDAKLLKADFTKEEFTKAVFKQGNNKSPGSDGITTSFFKFYWKIVEEDTWKAIDDFFKPDIIYNVWKDSLIVLIPKIKKPTIPSNYRPISLCQSTYKFVATMILNRMKNYIAKCITEEQAAFLNGRSMSDHCLLAQEVIHKLRISKRRTGFMAIKLDMEQAYDSMNWETLFQVLNMFGFPKRMIMLIMERVRNARFSFMINGRTSKWSIAENGFRQGCPLSPYLYILCSHLFSLAMQQRGQELGIQISQRAHKVSHLLFADDVLLFSQASKTLATKLYKIVVDFCSWTGLRVNDAKSQIMFRKGMQKVEMLQVKKILKFKIVEEFQYLGVLHEIDRCCRNFIWHKRDGKKGLHYIAWKTMCKSKSQGGLNFHSAVSRSGPIKARLTWRVLKNQNSLLHQIMTGKYGDSWWQVSGSNGKSIAWKVLNEGAEHLKPLLRWRVVNGRKIDVLKDIWLLDKRLVEWPITANCVGLEGLKLSNFITENGFWNLEELQCFFTDEIITLVLQLPIDRDADEDYLEEIYFPLGKTLTARALEASSMENSGEGDMGFYTWLTKLKLSVRVELF
ncbi:hypothetical protein KFK09_007221 [Dendrobium nobile]|uniref:Uncharacterized protein n=1 Tax=Dendrobium nobile TaxID=94219 RepID=A0A8T3BVV3_DENNO|nr:hypothetical protein KFK09_007221 [Dendrobium nobile]